MIMKIVISSFALFFSMQCISQQAQSNSKTSTGIEQTIVAEPVIEETTPGIAISNKKEQSGQVEPIQPIIEPVDPKAQTTKKKIGG
jgi:hypothetical protein